MAVHVDLASVETAKPTVIHLLPCFVEHDGPANVQDFFTKSIRGENDDLSSTFRGRELRGQVLDISKGYKGIILMEPSKPFTEDQDRQVKVNGTFQKFTNWNLQTPASVNDKIVQALTWPALAQAIHKPIRSEDDTDSDEQQHMY